MGVSCSKINDYGVSTLKQACGGQYSGSLKLRFECTQNRSAPFLTLLLIAPEIHKQFGVTSCGNTCKLWHKNSVFLTINRASTHSFSPEKLQLTVACLQKILQIVVRLLQCANGLHDSPSFQNCS